MGNIFNNAGQNYHKITHDNPQGIVDFNKSTIALFDSLLAQRQNARTHQIPLTSEAISELKKVPFQFISTPHPIGNLTELQGELFDHIAHLEQYKKNYQEHIPEITECLDELRFTEKELQTLQLYLESDIDAQTRRQLEYYQQNAHSINEKIDMWVQQITTSQDNAIELIQEDMAHSMLSMGIPTEIVTSPIQTMQIGRKNRLLKKRLGTNELKSWLGVDADGDHLNSIAGILGVPPEKKLGLKDIYDNYKKLSTPDTYEPRISCDRNKKGVHGILHQIEEIEGVKRIKSVNDILDEEIFEKHYAQFKQFLDSATYQEEPLAIEGSKKSTGVNNKLDFIMRVCSPMFVKSNGLVLSDFPSDDRTILPRLIFITKAVEKYLSEHKGIPLHCDQVFLPLCESKQSIEGAQKAFNGFLSDIDAALKDADNAKIKHIQSIIRNNLNQFIYGNFSGPSDLTKDMGSQSVTLIQKSVLEMRKTWNRFVQEHPILNLANTIFVQEYGVGTSPKRGGGLVIQGARACTIQGTNLSTTNSLNHTQSAKIYQALDPESGISYPIAKIPFSQGFIDRAAENHQFFWDEKAGIITKEFDHLRKNPLFSVIDRIFANNQGTRGQNGIATYEDSRAITAAIITSYTGLISFPGFPGFRKEAPNNFEPTTFDLNDIMKHPIGVDIIIKELFQICSIDHKRAETLGFSANTITHNSHYVNTILEQLCIQSNVEYHPQKPYEDIVKSIVGNLAQKCTDPQISRILVQFEAQIPNITFCKNQLTEAVNNAHTELEKERKVSDQANANLGIILNSIANMELPTIPAAHIKEQYLSAEKQEAKET